MPRATGAPTAPVTTVDSPDRIVALDILRGFALFGMIVVHFHQNLRVSTPETLRAFGEEWLGNLIWMGIEEKSWGTFALLFGVGFAVLMMRAEQRGQPVFAFYLRRLAALLVIGIVLQILTGFTILVEYAIWGVPLIFIRKWPAKVLLPIAILSAGSFSIGPLYEWATLGHEGADRVAAAAASERTQAARPPRPQTYGQMIAQRSQSITRAFTSWRILVPSSSFALFIIGLLAVRHGVFDHPRRHVRLIVTFMTIGVICWIIAWWNEWFGWPLLRTEFGPQAVRRVAGWGFGVINEQWLAFTYVGALLLLLTFRPKWIERLALVGVAGRMALTNYILQAVVISIIASRFALGLHVRPYYYFLGAVLLCGLTVVWSRFWLSRFRYGPLEWGWRAVTYLRVPALARQA